MTLAKRDIEIKELKKLSESSNGIFESKLKVKSTLIISNTHIFVTFAHISPFNIIMLIIIHKNIIFHRHFHPPSVSFCLTLYQILCMQIRQQ